MTNPAVLEALAKAMNGPHLPVTIDDKHTFSELRNVKWQNIGKGDRQNFLNQAAAVLELVGPKPLKWIEHCPDTGGCSAQVAQGEYVAETDEPCGEFGLWTPGQGEGSDTQLFYPTLEAAQAIAQAHADAAHWANTKLGDML